jgi:hypothetical protein
MQASPGHYPEDLKAVRIEGTSVLLLGDGENDQN